MRNFFLLHDIRKDAAFTKNALIVMAALLLFFMVDAAIGFMLKNGLEKYYGLNSDAEIALVGHSHLMLGVDKNMLEDELGVPVAKYTREGVNIADRAIMIQQLLNHNSNLKTVIYGVDAWSFTGEGLSANSHKLFYPFMGTESVDHYIRNQAEFTDYWMHKLVKTARYNEQLFSGSMRGYLKNWSNLKYGHVDTVRLEKDIKEGNFRKINNSIKNIEILQKSIKELTSEGIQVILLYVPTIQHYNAAEPEKFKQTIAIFENLAKDDGSVEFINYLDPWAKNYSLFFDPIHMNPEGQRIITNQLIKDIKQLESNNTARLIVE